MTTNSILVKVLILYFSINLMLYASGTRLSDPTVFGSLVSSTNTSASVTDPDVQYSIGSIGATMPNVDQTSGSTALSFIDVLGAVGAFIRFLIVMFAGIFIVFLPFPGLVQLFVGVPMAFVFLIGLIYFTRSGQ